MLYWADSILTNQYHVTMNITTACRDHESQNIAMDRMNYMLHDVFRDSVMIDAKEHDRIRLLKAAGLRVTTLPAEPVDQIIGLMLYCKMNAVCEGRLVIDAVNLCSDHGDHIWYLHDDTESVGPFQNAGWWNDADPSQWQQRQPGKTVVNLKTKSEWTRLELDWPTESDTNPDGKIVFAKFDRDQ